MDIIRHCPGIRRSLFGLVLAAAVARPLPSGAVPVTVTLLHTNDFHGNLELSGSNPGAARVAYAVNTVRTALGVDNVALLDGGDIMQGSLLSNLSEGFSTIDVYKAMGYDVAVPGNHDFEWGSTVLGGRVTQAGFPFVSANIVVNDTGNCGTAGWTAPSFAQPWTMIEVGPPAGDHVHLGVIGVTTQETPSILPPAATAGLCFKDPVESVVHYYDAMKTAGADVIVVLSHLGNVDGGYGYGLDVYGDQTLARRLYQAGKPADLILGGHSHTNLTVAQVVEGTTVAQAYYNGRNVGRADLTVDRAAGTVAVAWSRIQVGTGSLEDAPIKAQVAAMVSDPAYQAQVNRVVGYTSVNITRNYNGDSLMGRFVNDAVYGDLNGDADPSNDVDIVFNNPGALRADIATGGANPYALTYGTIFGILPFGNATVIGEMTGAQIQDLLNQSATLFKGALQTAGLTYTFYNKSDALPGPQPWAWGAWNVEVWSPAAGDFEPLEMGRIYRVATNEFLAPAGQDGFTPFKYMTNPTYHGDMLNSLVRWVEANCPVGSPYSRALDGRIVQDVSSVIPVTLLHHNDSHGNLVKGAYVGYTQLATLIKQERAHNPSRTLLLHAGDFIQGDTMLFLNRTASPHPQMTVMKDMDYTAALVGNHEYDFGPTVFKNVLGQADFPILGANVIDDGSYGLSAVPVVPFTSVSLPNPPGANIQVAILGLGNHNVPDGHLPGVIPGLTFTDPILAAQSLVPALTASNDAVVALTHIGFTEIPANSEIDGRNDARLAAETNGIDAIIGGHGHTNPAVGAGGYRYLPAVVGSPGNTPVLVTQAYRYNNTLGEVVLGLVPKSPSGYRVVTRVGRYISVSLAGTEDPATKATLDPYLTGLNTWLGTGIGSTEVPISSLSAFLEETNGANLEADAARWALDQQLGPVVDFHLSGSNSNRKIAPDATPSVPTPLTKSTIAGLVPFENSLVVMRMNGPQIKKVLERAYRNYWYYKYVTGYGGYSYYTTCMIDIDSVGRIIYNDLSPAAPDGNNVVSLTVDGAVVDLADASTYYNVSTLDYLALGFCNFNDGGASLWPVDQIESLSGTYIRDAVIDYIASRGAPISPAVEGRLRFLIGGNRRQVPLIIR
jgi:2',3'-cyclic-nucleotide 2'-phosphodiesterase (5'-nucleotidase family)